MNRFTSRLTALCILCVCATFSATTQAADTRMSEDEIWFLVDSGLMDEKEAWFILDTRENEQQKMTKTTPNNTQGLAGLGLGSGRIQSLAGLGLGSGR